MTCRHVDGDPTCTTRNPGAMQRAARVMSEKWDPPTTPDNENYDVLRTEPVGSYLVIEVRYPNCARCSYEGRKVLVFEDTNLQQAIQWKRIDPHFRAPEPRTPRAAPPPSARFPANDAGWADAVAYAKSKAQPEPITPLMAF